MTDLMKPKTLGFLHRIKFKLIQKPSRNYMLRSVTRQSIDFKLKLTDFLLSQIWWESGSIE